MADATAVIVVVGGANVTKHARVGQVRIDDILNDAPNTAALTLIATARYGAPETAPFFPGAFDAGAFNTRDNRAPVIPPPRIDVGMPIEIYLGAIDPAFQVFGGHVTTREQTAEFDVPANVRYDLNCIDWTRRLNARIAHKDYGAASATAIVTDLIANFAPTIGTAHVAPGLPTVDGGITFTFESVSRALSRIAEKIGAYWFVDYAADVHFWTGTEAGPTPAPIVPGADFAHFKITVDLTQVRTRLLVEGDGGSIAVPLPDGDAILPLDTVEPFNAAGGMATRSPAQRLTYTGKHAGGIRANTVGVGTGGTPPPAPPGPPTAALAGAGVAGGLSGGPYVYAYTLELADGARSSIGASSGPVTIAPAANPPPTNCALPTPPIAGPIRAGVTATYATSFYDANGNQTIATTGGNVVTGRSIGAPTGTPGATVLGGGAVDVGWHWYVMTWITAAGETAPSPLGIAVQTTSGLQTINLGIAFPTDPRVVAVRIYRSSTAATNAGPAMPWRKVADLTGSSFSDVSADAALPTLSPPTVGTADTGEGAIVTVPTSTDPRIVGRCLYRKDDGGEYRLVADLRDNVTTSFADTLPASGGDLAPRVNRVTTGAVNLTVPVGPPGTVTRRIFRTAAGRAEFRELTTIADNTTTAIVDTTPDANLGGSPLPELGGGDATSPPPTAIGADTIRLTTIAGFPPSGWIVTEAAAFIRYTATIGNDVDGWYVYGIPTSGQGSIAAAIPAGTGIQTVPELIGVYPVSRASQGDTVQLLVQVDDVPAQTALAALDGSDGVIEHYVQDRRLSEAGARARALADLALFKNPETRLTYTTHDPNTRSGQTVHVDLPAPTSIVGDFLIQKVTIADVSIAKNWYPSRAVDASTTRFSFDDVLARLLMDQR